MMTAPAIIAGFMIGAAGSFHCVGMCGPLALSLPVNHYPKFQKFIRIACYNLGRVSTYTALGILFGLLGQSFAMAGFQQTLSVSAGIFLLLVVLAGKRLPIGFPFFKKFQHALKVRLGALLTKEKSIPVFYAIGLINGLLPCGLVYVAIASAVATGSAWQGGVLMLFFGLGTIPLLFLLMLAGQYFSATVRQHMRRAVPYFVALMGCILLLRGLNLGIPYISPRLPHGSSDTALHCQPAPVKK